MAVPAPATSLLGIPTTATGSGASMLGAAGTFGAGPQLVASMLATTASDFIRRIVTGTVMDKSPARLEKPPDIREGLEWQARHPGSVEEAREKNPTVGTVLVSGPGKPVYDVFTGEFLYYSEPETADPNLKLPTFADWQTWNYYQGAQEPPPSPAPAPAPPPAPTPAPSGGKPMGMISTGVGFLGGLLDDVGGLVGDLLPIAQQTAPLWGMAAPKAATVLTGGVPVSTPPIQQVGAPQVSVPLALPGGAGVQQAGWDIMVPESQRIQPYQTAGRTRVPSTFTLPYETATGTKYAFYRNMGRPLLYSGDLAAVKRARKAASKARRRVGGR